MANRYTAIQLYVKTTDFCQIKMIYGQIIGLNHFQLFLKSFKILLINMYIQQMRLY